MFLRFIVLFFLLFCAGHSLSLHRTSSVAWAMSGWDRAGWEALGEERRNYVTDNVSIPLIND